MPSSIIWLYVLESVFLVSLISLVGVLTLSNKLKKILIYFVSFSAGALFGDAFIHLLPGITEKSGFTLQISLSLLGGIIIFFILEKILRWQHCHNEICEKRHIHTFAYMNLVGDAFHNFLDGIIIAASYLISVPAGIATTIAVVFHEIPQEIGDFGVLLHGGFSKSKALAVNFLSALAAVVGAILILWLGASINNLEIIITAVATGGFIYIAGSDLIPEIHKHSTKIKITLLQLFAFILGILVMAALLLLE